MDFYRLVRDFLTIYLPEQKAASPNTIKSYKNTLNLLIDYTKESLCMPMSEINFKTITRDHVEGFLSWIETVRECSVSSRNQRLSSIRAFYKYAANRNVTVMSFLQELEKIPLKKQGTVPKLK